MIGQVKVLDFDQCHIYDNNATLNIRFFLSVLQFNIFIVASVENPDTFHHVHIIHGNHLFSDLDTSVN